MRVCLANAATASRCLLTDNTCFCGPQVTESAVLDCAQKQCSKVDLMSMIRLTSTLCGHKPKDRGVILRAQQCLWAVIASVCIIIRVVHRLLDRGQCRSRAALTAEDVCLSLTYLFSLTIYTIIATFMTGGGLGRDFWALSFKKISNLGFWLYLIQMLYVVAISLLRNSFLLFYLRVFAGNEHEGDGKARSWRPGGRWKLRRILWCTIAIQSVISTGVLLAVIFQCWPIYKTWKGWKGDVAGVCIPPTALMQTNSGVSIAIGLWIFYLPLSQLRRLDLTRGAVIGVAIMLCVGSLVLTLSILRLAPSIRLKQVFLVRGGPAELVGWSTAELTAGIICICMPSMRVVGIRALVALLAHTPWRLPDRDLSFAAKSPFGTGSGADKMEVTSSVGLASQEGKTHLFPSPPAPVLSSDRSPSSAVSSWTAPSSWECRANVSNASGRVTTQGRPGTDNRGSVSRKSEDAPSSLGEGGVGAPVRRIATPDYFVPRRFPPSKGKRRYAPNVRGGSRSSVSRTGLAPPPPVRTYRRPISREKETVEVPDIVD
ncbi:hypothetical protein MAPG_01186 [Magnaporthiopsis poae ATCC 64411]|uniref:Uncharacterized protein n=1 Tax=Magnaporthiopsis poae (strain ATCC 64411 / 73-15) TaxID=644358 RepID=A0A0C4DN14_MAGP6|nr:hypothetical protein MAPG_01186 [Magnaporthiopsis poae ATCC 64411]